MSICCHDENICFINDVRFTGDAAPLNESIWGFHPNKLNLASIFYITFLIYLLFSLFLSELPLDLHLRPPRLQLRGDRCLGLKLMTGLHYCNTGLSVCQYYSWRESEDKFRIFWWKKITKPEYLCCFHSCSEEIFCVCSNANSTCTIWSVFDHVTCFRLVLFVIPLSRANWNVGNNWKKRWH